MILLLFESYLSLHIVILNLAFSWGSSKQGKADLACVNPKFVAASCLKNHDIIFK